jgi:hypothetical protein
VVVIIKIVDFVWVVTSCSLVNVSEEHGASIFRFEMCRVRNWFGHRDILQGRWPFRPTGGCPKM